MDNGIQQQTPLQTPTQEQSFKDKVLNQRGNFIIILGVILVIIILGIGGYLLTANRNKSTTQDQQRNISKNQDSVQTNQPISNSVNKIAYLKDKNVWVIDVATRKMTQITTDSRLYGGLNWSPDGKKLAFTGNADKYLGLPIEGWGASDLFIFNFETEKLIRLTQFEPPKSALNLSWHPNSNKFVYSVSRGAEDNYRRTHIIGTLENPSLQTLPQMDTMDTLDLSWSPSGSLLVGSKSDSEPVNSEALVLLNDKGKLVKEISVRDTPLGTQWVMYPFRRTAWLNENEVIVSMSKGYKPTILNGKVFPLVSDPDTGESDRRVYAININNPSQIRELNPPKDNSFYGWELASISLNGNMLLRRIVPAGKDRTNTPFYLTDKNKNILASNIASERNDVDTYQASLSSDGTKVLISVRVLKPEEIRPSPAPFADDSFTEVWIYSVDGTKEKLLDDGDGAIWSPK